MSWVSVRCSGSSSKVSSNSACLLSEYIIIAASDTDQVMDEVITLAESWQKMLISLHLPSLKKSTIAAAHPTDPSACLRTVIVLWLQREYDVEQYGPPSWRALVEAVADPAGGNDCDLAESIAEKYSGARQCVSSIYACNIHYNAMSFFVGKTIARLGSPIQSSKPADLRRAISVKMSGGGGEVGGEGGGVSGDSESSADLSEQLIRASKDGDLGKVKYLVEVKHVDTHSCRDENDATPLHYASLSHLDIVRYLVEEQQCDVKCRDKYGSTPLNYAAMGGRLDIVQYLISERGCDPMCRGLYGRTALHSACQTGKLNVVKYLVEDLKVGVSCRDDDLGATPLHVAAQHGTLDVVQYMIEEQQCDVECRNKYGDTPLHHAAYGGRLDIVQYLISERGCDPMCRSVYGRTPLHYACEGGKLNVVKYLVEDVKVEPSCRDEDDATPLHIASLCGHLLVVRLLVEDYLCDPAVSDKSGVTPADKAQSQGHTHITSYLSSIEKIVSSELF